MRCKSLKPNENIPVHNCIAAFGCRAGNAEDKAFTDKYKTAFESKDTNTLESFLYTTGSDPAAVEFYKMMMTAEAGSKISSIELAALTPEEMKKRASRRKDQEEKCV